MGDLISGDHAGDVPLVPGRGVERLYEDVKRLELPFIDIDTTMSEDDLVDQMSAVFGFRAGDTDPSAA